MEVIVTRKVMWIYSIFLDMKCLAKSRDDGMLLCSDGSIGKKWNGCSDNDQVRVQCPSGHLPCNGLRGKTNGTEFLCSSGDCSTLGGIRDCTGTVPMNAMPPQPL